MGRLSPTHLAVGRIRRPHGVKGEVVVTSLSDHPEGIFSPGVILRSGTDPAAGPDPDLPPLRVETSRPFQDGFLVCFGGMRDRNDVEDLRGLLLFQHVDAVAPLADDELFHHQLIGLSVHTVAGKEIGEVRELVELPPSVLLEVRTPRGTQLIPFNPAIVTEVDLEAGRLVVDPPEGLLDLNR